MFSIEWPVVAIVVIFATSIINIFKPKHNFIQVINAVHLLGTYESA